MIDYPLFLLSTQLFKSFTIEIEYRIFEVENGFVMIMMHDANINDSLI